MRLAPWVRWLASAAPLLMLPACRSDSTDCARCRTLVIAATGEPTHLLPPLVQESVARDIGDQIYERLADLAPGGAPIDSSAYRPALAVRWERVDSVRWRFHLRPGARWQDGRPVTAEDVRFSFDAFADSTLGSQARDYLAGKLTVTAEDSAAVLIQFARPSSEQLFDATYHVRILPSHVWSVIPRDRWPADTSLTHLVGSGPYRVAAWKRGEYLRLVADSTATNPPAAREVVWRFTQDPDAAINLVLSHEADLLETAGGPRNVERAANDSTLRLLPYASAAYGFLGFRIRGGAGAGEEFHPIFGDVATRRGLAMAVDRETLARSTFGREAKAPPGPMSQLLWIWDDGIRTLPFDTAQAARTLEAAGWRRRDTVSTRQRGSRALSFDILVPSTSPSRRQIAVALQAMWQAVGAAVTVTAVDFPVFQERLEKGQFDSYIGAWLDEPTPRGLAEQWTRAGWGVLNYGHYSNPEFDALFERAERAGTVDSARRLYRQAMDTLNADAPAIFLYAPANVAIASRRVQGVEIDPYSWASSLRTWRLAR